MFLLTNISFSQELMTIGEVFDFSINDEFHYTHNNDSPPNGRRIKITDKYYSTNSDTVFYDILIDRYFLDFGQSMEDWFYHQIIETETISYSNLDSCITTLWMSYDPDMAYYDTIIEYSTEFCNTLINGYSCGYFGVKSSNSLTYGKGIGVVGTWESVPEGYSYYNDLIYFKKGDNICGTPDTTLWTKSPVKSFQSVKIFPNPANSRIYIEMQNDQLPAEFLLYSTDGKLVFKEEIVQTRQQISLDGMRQGVYFYRIIHSQGQIQKSGKLVLQ
jgi:hypothetical protein